MKKLNILFIVFALAFISCNDDSISARDKREAKEKAKQESIDVPVTAETELIDVPTSVGIAPVEETIEKVIHVTYTTVSTDSSYWYIVMKDKETTWHGTVSLPTPYFNFKEAKKQFEGAKGKCYFKFILQINKESLENWNTYND